jgi:hypothetical protein
MERRKSHLGMFGNVMACHVTVLINWIFLYIPLYSHCSIVRFDNHSLIA